MTCLILLDRYDGLFGPGQYAVSYRGATLADCQAQTRHDGQPWAEPKQHGTYEGPTVLTGPEGNDDPGGVMEVPA